MERLAILGLTVLMNISSLSNASWLTFVPTFTKYALLIRQLFSLLSLNLLVMIPATCVACAYSQKKRRSLLFVSSSGLFI